MRQLASRKGLVLGAVGLLSGGIAALEACSSSSSPASGTGADAGQDSSAPASDAGATAPGCTGPGSLQVLFSPMYSAYEPSHPYQIPAIVNGVSNAGLTWTASPASAVTFAPDPTTGGVMLTMQQAPSGPVTITASGGGHCGSSTLTITPATAQQWQTGYNRYNSGIPLIPACLVPGFGAVPDGGCPDAGPACTNCHGPGAMAQFGFQDIAHTPEQTGGFSDQDMIGIFTQALVPGCGNTGACLDGGYFDPTIINIPEGGPPAYEVWRFFHQWTDIQGPDQQAMVVYLRSLPPTPQTGSSNFGGGRPGDAGLGPPGDAGIQPPADGGTSLQD